MRGKLLAVGVIGMGMAIVPGPVATPGPAYAYACVPCPVSCIPWDPNCLGPASCPKTPRPVPPCKGLTGTEISAVPADLRDDVAVTGTV
jgi:hypothetical protein